MVKGKLRHIAIETRDPEKTAEFYKKAFGMEEVGRTDSPIAKGIYISDGVINVAILDFHDDQLGLGSTKTHVGLHHLGFVVDNLDESSRLLEAELGSECLRERPTAPTSFFEVKHRGPDGVVVDTTEHPWVGTGALE
jgi:catechol 2,3-dioxygenase-like lactoylglutathione lyase family enzyme